MFRKFCKVSQILLLKFYLQVCFARFAWFHKYSFLKVLQFSVSQGFENKFFVPEVRKFRKVFIMGSFADSDAGRLWKRLHAAQGSSSSPVLRLTLARSGASTTAFSRTPLMDSLRLGGFAPLFRMLKLSTMQRDCDPSHDAGHGSWPGAVSIWRPGGALANHWHAGGPADKRRMQLPSFVRAVLIEMSW